MSFVKDKKDARLFKNVTIDGNLSVGGTLTLTGGLTLNGNVIIGSDAADSLTVNAEILGDLTFRETAAHTILVAASAATVAGWGMTVRPGTGGAASAAAVGGAGGAMALKGADGGAASAAQAAGAGGAISLKSGDAGSNALAGGGAGTGNVTVDSGAATGAGVNGTVLVGGANAEAVQVGRAGKTSRVMGALQVDEASNLNGATTLGNAAADDITFTGSIAGNVHFKNDAAHTLDVAQSGGGAVGRALSITAGAAAAAGGLAGGAVTINGGAGDGAGVAGAVTVGSTSEAVDIGQAAKMTTVKGTFNVDEAATFDGPVTLGNASADDVILTGYVNSGITFKAGGARAIRPDAEAAETAGDALTISAGAGGATAGAAAGGAGATMAINGGAGGAGGVAQLAGAGGHVTIYAGDSGATGGAGGAAGGNVTIRAGNSVAPGADGTVTIGDANTSSVELAVSGITTNVNGPLVVDEQTDLNGNTNIGNLASDTLTLTCVVDSDLTFDNGANRIISVEAAAADGDDLTVRAGAGGGAGPSAGGDLLLDGGAKVGAGADGLVKVGSADTSAVEIGKAGTTTTVKGALNVDEAFSTDAATTLGSAADDDITLNGSVASGIKFKAVGGGSRTIDHAQPAGNVVGDATVIASGQGGSGGGANAGGDMTIRAGAGAGGGAAGIIYVGATNAASVELGAVAIPTNVNGALDVDGAATLNGAVTLGNLAADDVTITGSVVTEIPFKAVGAGTMNIYPRTGTGAAAGDALVVAAGAGGSGGGAQAGGALTLRGGAGAGGGANGALSLGETNTASITLGAATIATTIAGQADLNGDVNLGSAATDTITFVGVVDSAKITFDNGANHTIDIEAAAADGDDLTIAAGAGGGAGPSAGGDLTLNAGAKVGAGADGVVKVGAANTSEIQMGAAGVFTAFEGPVEGPVVAATGAGALTRAAFGVPQVLILTIPDGVTGDIDFTNAPWKFRVIGCYARKVTVSADAGDQGALQTAAGAAITNTLSLNVAAGALVQAGLIDPATHEIAAAGTLRWRRTRSTNADCVVHVTVVQVA